jgi:hypothetical protein
MVSVYVALEKKAAPSGWNMPLEGWSAASSALGWGCCVTLTGHRTKPGIYHQLLLDDRT